MSQQANNQTAERGADNALAPLVQAGSQAAETAPALPFELSDDEAAYHERQFAAHQAQLARLPELLNEQRAERQRVFAALLAKYPLPRNARVWRHSDVGERGYIEIAVNGGYFDPRTTAPSYRPDLEPLDFGAAPTGVFVSA